MRILFTFMLAISSLTLAAQGIQEEFSQDCSCWTITNHYDNGQVSMIHHENEARKKNGELKHFSTEGKLIRLEEWKDGSQHGITKHFHPDGSLYLEANYEMGKKIGTWTFLEPDGTPTQEITYTGKGSDGTYAYYYAGVRYAEQTIEEGELVDTKVLDQKIYDIVQEESGAQSK